jgi:hypothetical protein
MENVSKYLSLWKLDYWGQYINCIVEKSNLQKHIGYFTSKCILSLQWEIFIRNYGSDTYIITVDNNFSKKMAATVFFSLFLVEINLDIYYS